MPNYLVTMDLFIYDCGATIYEKIIGSYTPDMEIRGFSLG